MVSLPLAFHSCSKSNDNSVTLIKKSESISMGAGYANEIYYRLSDGLLTSVPRNNWDIAFVVSAREASILANTTAGAILKVYPTSSGWNFTDPVDTTGYSSWVSLCNSDTTWTEGAFNDNATGHPNYGWGDYDMNTHNLTGVSMYIIKTSGGSYKKIWIETKTSSEQKYTFQYSDLDGSNEHTVDLDLAGANKNFIYYSLDTDQQIDREPDTDKWDILFTKYVDRSINYTVTGVLQNIGITACESTDTLSTSKVFPSSGFLTNISTVGSDWKVFNMDNFQYSIDQTRVFYVKDAANVVYRIKFRSFEGSGTGNMSFDVYTLK